MCCLQVRNLCYMVTKREKMRNRYLESRRDVFHYQSAILRSQSGRKLNARDYEAIVSAHRQFPSIYDNPDAVIRTARIAESLAGSADWEPITMDPTPKTVDGVKRSKSATGQPRIKGHRPATSSGGSAAQKKRLPLTSSENPYAKPTYRSFEWLLPRRRSSVEDGSAVKRKRRRTLFDGDDASSSSLGKDSAVSMLEDGTANSSCTDSSMGRLFVDITTQEGSSEPNRSSRSPAASVEEDRRKTRLGDSAVGSAASSNIRDKATAVCVNGVIAGSESLASPSTMHELCSSTPLKRSPLHLSIDENIPVVSNHVSSNAASQRFNTLSAKLNSRHFSDILVDRAHTPSSVAAASRTRTTSQNSEDAFIDVVSADTPVTAAHSTNSPQRNSMRNRFADGLARLSKVKARKHLSGMNGLRQGTLDGFVRRGVLNGATNNRLNGIATAAENDAVTENEHHNLKSHGSPLSSVRLKQNAVDRIKTDGETLDRNTLDDQISPGKAGSSDNFVDLDSIEGVWRRRTSLRSSTALLNLLGPDVADLT